MLVGFGVLFLNPPTVSSTSTFMYSHLSGPQGIGMPEATPVVRLHDLSFDRFGPKAMIGTFTATTDSLFKAPIQVEAIIKYGRTKVCIHDSDERLCFRLAHWMTDW